MIEFETLCYLQNQKTGSTFVETLLRNFCTEGIMRYEKHMAPKMRKPGKFYFVNVRDPLDTYFSLFNFGLDQHGTVFERLRDAGHESLYAQGVAGFNEWLAFMLEPENAMHVYPGAAVPGAALLGLVSVRYLRLASLGFETAFGRMKSRDDVRSHHEMHRIVDETIRYESMQQELRAIVNGPLRHAFGDQDAMLKWLDSAPRINASTRREVPTYADLPKDLHARLLDHEWFLYESLYRPAPAKGRAS